jgi:hypothetical protein
MGASDSGYHSISSEYQQLKQLRDGDNKSLKILTNGYFG